MQFISLLSSLTLISQYTLANSKNQPPLFLLCFANYFLDFSLKSKAKMSSASSVCQGLQSCLEPLLFEPSFSTHQMAPTKQGLSSPWPQKQTETQNPKNWNFIQSITNTSYTNRKLTEEQVYVHPLVKHSSCTLSTRSLEMCTESIGSETGNGIDSFTDEFNYLGLEKQSFTTNKKTKTRESCCKVKHSSSFPPPLTSISGSEGVQVQTHREGGRLVIKAFSFPSRGTYFQTERENGRLRLSLLKSGCKENDNDFPKNEEEEEEETDENCDESPNEADFNGCLWDEHVKENEGKIGCKIVNGDWSSSRCNGDRSGSKRLPSLPFCVAIS